MARQLKLGKFAATTKVEDLVSGALVALKRPELTREDRQRVNRTRKGFDHTYINPAPGEVLTAMEAIWLELEDIMETVLPEYTEIRDNVIVPDWARLRHHSRRKHPDAQPMVGSVRTTSLKNPTPYVLEAREDEITLYRSIRTGTGYRWHKVWAVPATEAPAEEPTEPTESEE